MSITVTTDEHTSGHAWSDTLHLADRFRFSLYDAAYLELAQRQIFVLAGFDLSGNTLAVAPRRRRLIRWLLDRRENLK